MSPPTGPQLPIHHSFAAEGYGPRVTKVGTERDTLGALHPCRHLGCGAVAAVPAAPQREPTCGLDLVLPAPTLRARAPLRHRRTAGPPRHRPVARAARAAGIAGLSSSGPFRMTRSAARKRRRDVLFTLGAAVLLTLPLAVIIGRTGLGTAAPVRPAARGLRRAARSNRSSGPRSRRPRCGTWPGTRRPAPEPALALRRSGS